MSTGYIIENQGQSKYGFGGVEFVASTCRLLGVITLHLTVHGVSIDIIILFTSNVNKANVIRSNGKLQLKI